MYSEYLDYDGSMRPNGGAAKVWIKQQQRVIHIIHIRCKYSVLTTQTSSMRWPIPGRNSNISNILASGPRVQRRFSSIKPNEYPKLSSKNSDFEGIPEWMHFFLIWELYAPSSLAPWSEFRTPKPVGHWQNVRNAALMKHLPNENGVHLSTIHTHPPTHYALDDFVGVCTIPPCQVPRQICRLSLLRLPLKQLFFPLPKTSFTKNICFNANTKFTANEYCPDLDVQLSI